MAVLKDTHKFISVSRQFNIAIKLSYKQQSIYMDFSYFKITLELENINP